VIPLDETHDASLRSWVASANSGTSDFPIQNLPFGVFRRAAEPPRIGVAIGDEILDLRRACDARLLDGCPEAVHGAAATESLNALMSLERPLLSALRLRLSRLLVAGSGEADPDLLVPMKGVDLLLPARIGDYTDFYASICHATNVGRLFRPDNPLLPNYKYVPIAYHGRASSILVSGTAIRRPCGQVKPNADPPAFRATARLDYEAELGLFIRGENPLGAPVGVDGAEDRIFGCCLVNDWSARDIQAWEYQPLGPFLAKSFATTISPWVVTLEALAPFRSVPPARPEGDPPALPYLQAADRAAFDVVVETQIESQAMRERGLEPQRVSRASARGLYWTPAQMIAHHTSNGCNLRPGDLLATGTISGADPGTYGCMLEISRGGTAAVTLPSGEERSFLIDGDRVTLRASCHRPGFASIGFGVCTGIVHPPLDPSPANSHPLS
jgi:fumarylacetoacetase